MLPNTSDYLKGLKLPIFPIFLFALLLFSLYLAYQLMVPFLNTIIMGIVFTALCMPLHNKLLHYTKGKDFFAALLTLTIVILVIIIPITAFISALVPQAIASTTAITEWLSHRDISTLLADEKIQAIVSFLEKNFSFLDINAANLHTTILSLSRTAGQFIFQGITDFARNAVGFSFHLLLMLLIMFFLLKDGRKMLKSLRALIPMRPKQQEAILTNLRKVARAVLVGGALVAILQGIVGGVGMAICGLPALFTGALMAVASFVPIVGTGLVWIPACIYLVITGSYGHAFSLALWCIVLVTNIDTFLRPMFMKNSAGLSPFLLFMSIMGGLKIFGVAGIFYGPLILGFVVVMLSLYGEEYSDMLKGNTEAPIEDMPVEPAPSLIPVVSIPNEHETTVKQQVPGKSQLEKNTASESQKQ